jgi:phosphoglycerate dehydrogenase-like enzyme
MPAHHRLHPAAAAALCLGASLAFCAGVAPRASPSADATTRSAPAPDNAPGARAADTFGLQPAAQPVRERPGWHPPHVILVAEHLKDVVPQLQTALPAGVRLIVLSAATPRDIAAADATLGVCSPEVLAQATRLQWIQWMGAGVEGCVHQPLLHQHRVLLTNMQRVSGPSMAEHVIALMMALSRHLNYFMREQQQGHWAEDSPQLADLEGRTVLVVGLGGIGTEVARRAHALGMRVTATRASGREGPDYVSYVGLPDELLKLAREADFVVNCTPLTPQTTDIFNREFFAAMKSSAYFLSVGRGRSTVTADLVTALSSGKIAGAGLDVVDPEPLPPDSPLWRLPNVIITPHVSADTAISDEVRAALLRENLHRYVAGEPMLAVVDIERGY